MAFTWNYRRAKRTTTINGKKHTHYGIYEVYYVKGNKPKMISSEEKSPYGETLEDLTASYLLMAEAFNKPVLNYNDIANPKKRRSAKK